MIQTAEIVFFLQRKEGILDDEAIQLTQQLLSNNPDFATLWNYRREILMHLETVKLDHYLFFFRIKL